MRQVRCQRCSHMFTLNRDVVVAALEELAEKGQDYYTIDCPKCRRAIKVPRADMERMRPHEEA